MKDWIKVALVVGAIIFFAILKIGDMTDTYEEKFCKSYSQWNKYAWGVENNVNQESWENLKFDEFKNLQEIVYGNDPTLDIQLSKFADQWFTDSYNNDLASGPVMAAMLIVECEKYGVTVDEKYLK
jgi:hypothetical protein